MDTSDGRRERHGRDRGARADQAVRSGAGGRPVELRHRSGHRRWVLGPNGAGKTTTLRVLMGLVRPTGGTATISGKAYTDLPDPLRHVGAVLEASGFYPGRRARDHLRVQAMAGGFDPARADEEVELVGLQTDGTRRVGGFSLGMRQRLGIATAMLGDPEVLILDEPATASTRRGSDGSASWSAG